MCSGNDSGNTVMHKSLSCDSLDWQKISTLEIHCQLMLVFGDGVSRQHHLGTWCREFRSGLASVVKMAPFSQADQEHVNTAQMVELFLKNHQDTIHGLSVALDRFVKTLPHIVHIQLG